MIQRKIVVVGVVVVNTDDAVLPVIAAFDKIKRDELREDFRSCRANLEYFPVHHRVDSVDPRCEALTVFPFLGATPSRQSVVRVIKLRFPEIIDAFEAIMHPPQRRSSCTSAKPKSTDARKHLFTQKSGSLWKTPRTQVVLI